MIVKYEKLRWAGYVTVMWRQGKIIFLEEPFRKTPLGHRKGDGSLILLKYFIGGFIVRMEVDGSNLGQYSISVFLYCWC
jgi:hypothetical protein